MTEKQKIILQKLLDLLQPVSLQTKLFFIQHLAVMVKTGLPLHDALTTLAEEIEHKRFQRIIHDVAEVIEKGGTLAQGLERHPHVFPELFSNMIRAGETSGKLEDVLRELHLQLKKEHTLRSKVRGALIYPTVIIIVMIAITIFMMTAVVPRLLEIFDTINAELPLATRIVIGISRFTTAHGFLVAAIAVLVIGTGAFALHRPKGRALWHTILLRAPIIGTIVRHIQLARFARTLSSLMKTDIPFSRALSITGHVLGNVHYRDALLRFSQEIQSGRPLEELLREEVTLFPPLIRQMVALGEETGTVDEMLAEIATFYEEQVAATMENLPALIEPLLITVLGLGVAGLAVAIIMPMYSLAQQF